MTGVRRSSHATPQPPLRGRCGVIGRYTVEQLCRRKQEHKMRIRTLTAIWSRP